MIVPPTRNEVETAVGLPNGFRFSTFFEDLSRNINNLGAFVNANDELIVGSVQFPVVKSVIGGTGEVATAPQAELVLTTTSGSGTDVHATDLLVRAGTGTGNAAGASVKIQSSIPGVSSSTLQTISTVIEVLENKLSFFGGTPVAQSTAYTQTYSTATKTHSNLTSSTLTDSSGGTANNTVQALTDPADTPADADTLRDDLVANLIPELRNNFADVTAQINKLRTDIKNVKQVLNQVIDDLQSYGLLQ